MDDPTHGGMTSPDADADAADDGGGVDYLSQLPSELVAQVIGPNLTPGDMAHLGQASHRQQHQVAGYDAIAGWVTHLTQLVQQLQTAFPTGTTGAQTSEQWSSANATLSSVQTEIQKFWQWHEQTMPGTPLNADLAAPIASLDALLAHAHRWIAEPVGGGTPDIYY